MNCKTCEYFTRITDPNDVTRVVGNCIAHPPQFILLPAPQGMAPAWGFPVVEGDCVCGLFELILSGKPNGTPTQPEKHPKPNLIQLQ